MPRPTTKADLITDADKEYAALQTLLAALTDTQLTTPSVVGDWSVKDVLAHLHEWHTMALGWYTTGQRGETPALPAPGYNWGQLPALNHHIYTTYRDRPLADIRAAFEATHHATRALIDNLSNDVLFTPGYFNWAGKNTLGTYFVSTTGSHYRWARTEIKKGLKKLAPA